MKPRWLLLLVFVGVASCMVGRHFPSNAAGADRICVVRLDGALMDGRKIVDRLDEARADSSVKAVVLRIESPGGAVGASQEVYEAVRALDRVKPVVATIGNLGASGGYYAALGARRIWANPGSLTGSIGVITQFTDFHELMDKIGVRSKTVKSAEFKDAGTPWRAMTDRESALFQKMVADVYDQFRSTVAERRKVDSAALDTLADGRVLTGRQAWRAGLVDSIGTFNDAKAEALRLAELPSDAPIDEEEPKVPLLRRLLDPEAEGLSKLLPVSGARVEFRMP
ncbi:MAG: signal peptide peptidase SppA [Fibrobacterota bacterium]|nr:signal peptide peptidase SppA [Fibrobacterota bacterium]QQS05119.1 MAG: signal peptide peptidase SppA [Fibrobacterota bacterium]